MRAQIGIFVLVGLVIIKVNAWDGTLETDGNPNTNGFQPNPPIYQYNYRPIGQMDRIPPSHNPSSYLQTFSDNVAQQNQNSEVIHQNPASLEEQPALFDTSILPSYFGSFLGGVLKFFKMFFSADKSVINLIVTFLSNLFGF